GGDHVLDLDVLRAPVLRVVTLLAHTKERINAFALFGFVVTAYQAASRDRECGHCHQGAYAPPTLSVHHAPLRSSVSVRIGAMTIRSRCPKRLGQLSLFFRAAQWWHDQ